MGWRDLLTPEQGERFELPWTGERVLRSDKRSWGLKGQRPPDLGWYAFRGRGREATFEERVEANTDALRHRVRGYLVGDRLVSDEEYVDPDPLKVMRCAEPVLLLEPGLERFSRVCAGRIYPEGPLVYVSQEMPLGPEDLVLQVFLDGGTSLDKIKGVPPALDASFRMASLQRAQAARLRLELEKRRRDDEEKRMAEERRKELVKRLGDAQSRRELAGVDFPEAARAALRVGDAELLDHRPGFQTGEHIVKFRLDGKRYECVCDTSLRIIDSGICLVDHDTEVRGDTFFTLESLPGVIRQANREGVLVVFRHV